jgi:hypothetical protein
MQPGTSGSIIPTVLAAAVTPCVLAHCVTPIRMLQQKLICSLNAYREAQVTFLASSASQPLAPLMLRWMAGSQPCCSTWPPLAAGAPTPLALRLSLLGLPLRALGVAPPMKLPPLNTLSLGVPGPKMLLPAPAAAAANALGVVCTPVPACACPPAPADTLPMPMLRFRFRPGTLPQFMVAACPAPLVALAWPLPKAPKAPGQASCFTAMGRCALGLAAFTAITTLGALRPGRRPTFPGVAAAADLSHGTPSEVALLLLLHLIPSTCCCVSHVPTLLRRLVALLLLAVLLAVLDWVLLGDVLPCAVPAVSPAPAADFRPGLMLLLLLRLKLGPPGASEGAAAAGRALGGLLLGLSSLPCRLLLLLATTTVTLPSRCGLLLLPTSLSELLLELPACPAAPAGPGASTAPADLCLGDPAVPAAPI